MSKVFNMVGGGGKNISSIVITGLKSTDTVTCTKDGKSYTATWDSTYKHWEILGLPLGTFTVTATDGTKTSTKTVLIDIAGIYEIEMIMVRWLYKQSNEYTDFTGGWVPRVGENCPVSNLTLEKRDDSIYVKNNLSTATGYAEAGAGTNNLIDITDYSVLKCNILNATKNYMIGMCNVEHWSESNPAIYIWITDESVGIKSFDISGYSGKYYIFIAAVYKGGSVEFDKVWLE